jgi:hypothetical protein
VFGPASVLQVLTMVRTLKRALFPSLLLAALLVGLCRGSLAQGDAGLEAPGLAPFPATLARGATLFQSVRIFDGKGDALGSLRRGTAHCGCQAASAMEAARLVASHFPGL